MNSTDIPRLTKALEKAGRVYDKSANDQMVSDYYDLLSDLLISQVEDAVHQHCAHGKFFPRPADIRRRVTGNEGEGVSVGTYPTQCKAQGCPNPVAAHTDRGSLCIWHFQERNVANWPTVTECILRGDPTFEYPPSGIQKARLSFLAESGQFTEMEAVCGERGLRWARAEVKAGRIKPNTYVPDSSARFEAEQKLAAARMIPEAPECLG